MLFALGRPPSQEGPHGKRRPFAGAEVFVSGGRKAAGRRVLQWVKEAESRGAGEILLTSMDADGTRAGFDCDLTARVSRGYYLPSFVPYVERHAVFAGPYAWRFSF